MPKVSKPQLRFIVRKDKLALRCTYNKESAEVLTDLSSDNFDKKKQMYIKDRKLNLQLDSILSKCEQKINNGCVISKMHTILMSIIPFAKIVIFSHTHNINGFNRQYIC